MSNVFTENAKIYANGTTTENGAYALSTTGDKLLDLYGSIGGMRDAEDTRLYSMFEDAIKEDKLLATKLMFYVRDVREGLGERKLGRKLMFYAATFHPEMLDENIGMMGEYGRFDDFYSIIGTALEGRMWYMMRTQLDMDVQAMNEGKPVSLLAKWVKTADASSPQTRQLGIKTAINLGYGNDIKGYKRIIRSLRKYIDVVERKMSAKEWNKVDYEKVPSRAMLVHRAAFRRNDEERFSAYVDAAVKGEVKIHAGAVTPYDLVHQLWSGNEDGVVEAQWKQLPDYVKSDTNILCMVDTSGSMNGRPIEVALSLGLYFAEHNTGDFHNMFMTFSERPDFQIVSGQSLREKLNNMKRAGWDFNTNINAAFEMILDHAKRFEVPQKDMPKAIIIISDMEIDECTDRSWTFYEVVCDRYRDAGYQMPSLVFWNVDSRSNVFHADKSRKGVQLASGESATVFKQVIESLEMTPVEAMLKILNSPRYDAITLAQY